MKRNLPLVASLSLNAVLAASTVAFLLHRPRSTDPAASNPSQLSPTPSTLSTPDPFAIQSSAIPANSNRNRNWQDWIEDLHKAGAAAYKQRARLIEEQGTAVDWEGVRGNLRQFAQQTEETLRSYLGDERFHKLNGKNALEPGN